MSFPDLPGLVSVASTLDEARVLAMKGLAFHLRGMAEDGEAIPEPSSLEDIMADRDNRDGVAILVEVADSAPKVMRINITMPEDALNEIDRHAERLGLTRSGFLLSAAREALKRQVKAA